MMLGKIAYVLGMSMSGLCKEIAKEAGLTGMEAELWERGSWPARASRRICWGISIMRLQAEARVARDSFAVALTRDREEETERRRRTVRCWDVKSQEELTARLIRIELERAKAYRDDLRYELAAAAEGGPEPGI